MSWLGVGEAIMGIFTDSMIIPFHKFQFANNTGSEAYTTRGTLPIRYELISAGTGTATNVIMKHICTTVLSEGGFDAFSGGSIYSLNNGTTGKTYNTERPLIALRLNQTMTALKKPRATINILNVQTISTTNADSLVRIYKFDASAITVLTGAAWINNSANNLIRESAIEYDLSATAVDITGVSRGVRLITSFYVEAASQIGSDQIVGKVNLHANIAGESEMIVITMQSLSGSTETGFVSVVWNEYE